MLINAIHQELEGVDTIIDDVAAQSIDNIVDISSYSLLMS